MSVNSLSEEEKHALLVLARQSVEAAASHSALPRPDLASLPGRLQEKGAAFVTLTEANGELRGCIGAL